MNELVNAALVRAGETWSPNLASGETRQAYADRALLAAEVRTLREMLEETRRSRARYRDKCRYLESTLPSGAATTTTIEWGVRYAPGEFMSVRWCPSQGGRREHLPYTEAEARADAARSGLPLVRRTRVEFEIEDDVTEWETVE